MTVITPNQGYFATSEIPLMGHPDTLVELLQNSLTALIEEKYDGLRHDLKLAIGGDTKNVITIAVFGNVQYHPDWYKSGNLKNYKLKQFYKDLRTALYETLKQQGHLSHPDADLESMVTKFFIRPQSADLHGIQEGAKLGVFGDQAHAIGYATGETREAMPVEFVLARKLVWNLEQAVKDGLIVGGYDGKVIVTVEKDDTRFYGVKEIIVAKQHDNVQPLMQLVDIVKNDIIPKTLGIYFNHKINIQVNNGDAWNEGGVLADMGVPCDLVFNTGIWTGADAPTGEDMKTKADGPLQLYARAVAKTLYESLRQYGCRYVTVDITTSIGSEEIKSFSVEIRDKNMQLMFTKKQMERLYEDIRKIFPTTANDIMERYWCSPKDLDILIRHGAIFGYTKTELRKIFGNKGYKQITWEYVDREVNQLNTMIEKYIKN